MARARAAHSGDSSDLAAFHAGLDQPATCISCHSGQGLPGRIDAMKLGVRDLAVYVGGHYPQPAPLTRAIADANCLKCHADIAKDRTFENHFHVFLARWRQTAPEQAASCVDCHSSHAQDGQAQIAFLNKEHTVTQCNACHSVIGDD